MGGSGIGAVLMWSVWFRREIKFSPVTPSGILIFEENLIFKQVSLKYCNLMYLYSCTTACLP